MVTGYASFNTKSPSEVIPWPEVEQKIGLSGAPIGKILVLCGGIGCGKSQLDAIYHKSKVIEPLPAEIYNCHAGTRSIEYLLNKRKNRSRRQAKAQ